MYAPWPQEEPKEQKTAEAKTEEQETKGTKAEDKHAEVRLAPSPSLRYSSQHARPRTHLILPPKYSSIPVRVTPPLFCNNDCSAKCRSDCCRAQCLLLQPQGWKHRTH